MPGYQGYKNAAVILMPKCGIQSIGHTLCNGLTEAQALAKPVRIAFVREYRDRFESGYSWFSRMRDKGMHIGGVPFSAMDSWEAYVDFALANKKEYWTPQIELLKAFANTYYRFEVINEKWIAQFPNKTLQHKNASPRLPTNDYRKADIDAYFGEDEALWLSL